MSPRPRKEQRHPNLQTAIKDVAWQQIAQYGAPALSLRAIAGELKISTPSIYNYYASRDVLVTSMIVDAFISLGKNQSSAISDLPQDNLPARLFSLGLAYRQWAITYPQRYQLIFGTPIAGYHAPEEITLPAGQTALIPLTETVQGLITTGQFQLKHTAPLTPELKYMLEAWCRATGGVHIEALYHSLIIWSRVHGLVSLEIGNQLPTFITNPDEVYRREIASLLEQYTLRISDDN